VVADAVGHDFDEDGLPGSLQCQSASLRCHLLDCEDVVAVDADGMDPVTYASARDAVAAVLLQRRGADGVAVVPTDEDDGAGSRRCNVERGVEVAFAGGTLPEIASHNRLGIRVRVLRVPHFESVCGACGMG